MNFQKRLIQIFKSFVERVFLPQINKNQSIIGDWNKFSILISTDNININQLQTHVDSLGYFNHNNSLDKKQSYTNQTSIYRKKDQINVIDINQQLTFNPNKTFGGEKAKITNYPVKQDFDEINRKNNYLTISNRQQVNKYRTSTNSTNITNTYRDSIDNTTLILSSLDKLYKNFIENQQKIQTLTQTY